MNNPQNIAILGTGIMGLMVAYFIKSRLPNIALSLYDRQIFPQDNASSKAGGMLAPYAELDHMPHRFLPAALRSIEIWQDIQDTLKTDFELQQNGSLILAHPEDKHLLSRLSGILPKDKNWRAVQAKDIQALECDLDTQTFQSGLLLQSEAHLHPRKTMHALYRSLPDITQTSTTPDALAQDFDLVIDCRGMGAKQDLVDLRGVKGEIMIVHNPEFKLSRPVRLMHPRYPLYIVPREGNIFMIGATIIESEENENVSMRSAMELQSALYSLHPSFAESDILEMCAGTRPAFADNMPEITIRDNIMSCNGLFRHGFLLSPIIAQSIVDYIQEHQNPYLDLFLKDRANADTTERQALRA